jgi:hypothetical protein
MPGSQVDLGTRIARVAFHPLTRALAVGLAVIAMFALLYARSYPWWIWAPACYLTGVFTLVLWLALSYLYQKSTYSARAVICRLQRERQRREGSRTD